MITLTQEDLKNLGIFIDTIPYKYGKPLADFLNQKIQEVQPKEVKDILAPETVKSTKDKPKLAKVSNE
jgi:hypothetical protein